MGGFGKEAKSVRTGMSLSAPPPIMLESCPTSAESLWGALFELQGPMAQIVDCFCRITKRSHIKFRNSCSDFAASNDRLIAHLKSTRADHCIANSWCANHQNGIVETSVYAHVKTVISGLSTMAGLARMGNHIVKLIASLHIVVSSRLEIRRGSPPGDAVSFAAEIRDWFVRTGHWCSSTDKASANTGAYFGLDLQMFLASPRAWDINGFFEVWNGMLWQDSCIMHYCRDATCRDGYKREVTINNMVGTALRVVLSSGIYQLPCVAKWINTYPVVRAYFFGRSAHALIQKMCLQAFDGVNRPSSSHALDERGQLSWTYVRGSRAAGMRRFLGKS